MLKITRIVPLVVLCSPVSAIAAQVSSTPTLAGELVISCAVDRRGDGHYTYHLAGRELRSLRGNCDPEFAANHVELVRVFRSSRETIVLVLEGDTASSQGVNILAFKRGAVPLLVSLYGGDPEYIRLEAPGVVHVTLPGSGYAVSEQLSTWKCEYNIDFRQRTVQAEFGYPRRESLPTKLCSAHMVRVSR